MKNLMRISYFTGILALLLTAQRLNASHEVGGVQSGVWSLKQSPYIVTRDILVPNGLILKIEEGVVIKFVANCQIRVEGGLIASGIQSKPIVFTSLFDKEFGHDFVRDDRMPRPSDWKGIEISDESDDYLTVLNYCIIRFSKWGIRCNNSLPVITNIMLVDNENSYLTINSQEYPFEPGCTISPISPEKRPSIIPLPVPAMKTDMQKVKQLMELKKQQLEQIRLRALQDSLRKANKIRPIHSKTGRIILDSHVFDHFHVQSINEVIGYMPGFMNIASIWSGTQITSRGITPNLSNNRIVYKVSGTPIYEPIAKSNYLEFISLDGIERIEIDRGIAFSHFNHNGMAGAVDFIPRSNDTGFINKSKIQFGNYGAKKLAAYLGLNRDSTFVSLSTNFMDYAGYWRNFPQDENGTIFRQKYASDLYNFSLFLKHASWNMFASYFEHDQFQLGLIPQLQQTHPTHRRGLVLSLNKAFKISRHLQGKIVGNYIRNHEKSEISNLELINSPGLANADYLTSQGHLWTVSVLSQYEKPDYLAGAGITVSHAITEPLFGMKKNGNEFAKIEALDTLSKISDYETSGFLRFGYNFSHFWGFDGKTSLHFNDSFDSPGFSVDAKVIYNPFMPCNSQLRYSNAIRAVTLMEERIYLPGLFLGNSNLKSENFEQWEWSTDIHIKPDVTVGFVAYHINNKSLIKLNQENYFTNTKGTFRTTGYECMVQGKLTNNIFLLSNIAHNQNKSSGWLYPKWKFSGIGKIQWFRKFSTLAVFQYLSQFSSEKKFGPYYIVNLSFVYHVLSKIRITLNGSDLLDQHPENPEYIRGEIPAIPISPGRTFFIALTIE